jgi:hypothetical protein
VAKLSPAGPKVGQDEANVQTPAITFVQFRRYIARIGMQAVSSSAGIATLQCPPSRSARKRRVTELKPPPFVARSCSAGATAAP